jgi:hypothetical protein
MSGGAYHHYSSPQCWNASTTDDEEDCVVDVEDMTDDVASFATMTEKEAAAAAARVAAVDSDRYHRGPFRSVAAPAPALAALNSLERLESDLTDVEMMTSKPENKVRAATSTVFDTLEFIEEVLTAANNTVSTSPVVFKWTTDVSKGKIKVNREATGDAVLSFIIRVSKAEQPGAGRPLDLPSSFSALFVQMKRISGDSFVWNATRDAIAAALCASAPPSPSPSPSQPSPSTSSPPSPIVDAWKARCVVGSSSQHLTALVSALVTTARSGSLSDRRTIAHQLEGLCSKTSALASAPVAVPALTPAVTAMYAMAGADDDVRRSVEHSFEALQRVAPPSAFFSTPVPVL